MIDRKPYEAVGVQTASGAPDDASPGAGAPPAAHATPGPAGILTPQEQVDPIAMLGGLVEKYGDVVRYQTRYGPCFLFVHPEHVHTILHRENYRRASLVKMMLGDGLLASDGPRWRSQRRLMQRDFHPASIAPFVSIMTGETARMCANWSAAGAAPVVNIAESMTRLTLRIVVQSLFSDDLSPAAATDLCSAITQTINDLGKISWTVFGAPVVFTPGHNAGYAAGKSVIDAACHEMIARRRSMPPLDRPRDLLTMLIEADTDTGAMNDRELRDEMVTMLVGGHETTALALAWAWKLIAEHPGVERRLHEEVDRVIGERTPVLADLPNLPWSQAVFQEAMRLYPPVWYMARVASEADVIHGHAVPKNACVLVSAWLTHRHKDFWPDPDRFDPSRFLPAAFKPAHRYAFFPFGGGRHQCLGMHFAQLEGTLIIAQLAQQFRVRPLAGQDIRPSPGITLRQSPELRAMLEPRRITPSPRMDPEEVA